MRVVRFYKSCSPPPPPPPPPPSPPRSPDPSGHSRTATASSRSQWALPDLNRDFQVAVGTAGPQPRLPGCSGHCRTSTATSRSQWALPDLNRELQIPVGTAGPERPDRMPEDMPDRMPEDMSDRMPEDMPDRMPEDLPDNMPEDMPDRMPDGMPEDMPEHMPEDMPEDMPEHLPEDMPEHLPEDMPEHLPEDMPDRMPDRMPENMSDRMPEDLPVTKCINVMVGITRSKVIFHNLEKNIIPIFIVLYHNSPTQTNELTSHQIYQMIWIRLDKFLHNSPTWKARLVWSPATLQFPVRLPHLQGLFGAERLPLGAPTFISRGPHMVRVENPPCPQRRVGFFLTQGTVLQTLMAHSPHTLQHPLAETQPVSATDRGL